MTRRRSNTAAASGRGSARRSVLGAALCLGTLLGIVAPGHAQAPLAGTGERMEIVANHPAGRGTTEMELAGNHAYVAFADGLAIIDISDPANPKTASVWQCSAGWGDIELNPEATLAIVANAYGGSCDDESANLDGSSLVLIDISDKTKPRGISGLQLNPSAHTITLDGTTMYINTGVWGGNPETTPSLEIYDISDVRKPAKLSELRFSGGTTPHDAYVDHRPDGKRIYYAASGHDHHVIDVTDPRAPRLLQTVQTPDIEYAHQDEPNFDRKMIVASDESLVGLFGGACGPGVGALHFYAVANDGQWAAAGAQKLGLWSPPPQAGRGCSSHVYWQAPNENRLTMGMYTAGITILDYSNPASVRQLGWFKPEGNPSIWGAKPHNGYVYASGARGLEILRYTGEGGQGWPATSGPAEVQRAARMGVTLRPAGGAPSSTAPPPRPPAGGGETRKLGRFRVAAKIRRTPGRRGRKAALAFLVTDAKGATAARVRFRKAAGRRAVVRASGVGVVGTYRWTIRAGGRVLARGRAAVREAPKLVLAQNRSVQVRLR